MKMKLETMLETDHTLPLRGSTRASKTPRDTPLIVEVLLMVPSRAQARRCHGNQSSYSTQFVGDAPCDLKVANASVTTS